mgnify:CR=1 FL=1
MNDLDKLYNKYLENNLIDNSLYKKYDVKKGLRNDDGSGVVVGLTNISDVIGYKVNEDMEKVSCEGQLIYRGLNIFDIYKDFKDGKIEKYEDICYLLLFGNLPNKEEKKIFNEYLKSRYNLPQTFIQDNIFNSPSINIMNRIQRAFLMLYREDEDPDDSSYISTISKGLSLLARLPAIIVYSYYSKIHTIDGKDLIIHPTNKDLDIGESFLYLLKGNNYSKEEVKTLNLILMLHADHGIGNNSTFTNLVVSSTGTDIYSSFAASVGSLKGPKHGGANILSKNMMDSVIDEVGLNGSDEEILKIIKRILNKDFFDKKGLVYGIGHAIYTKSDPRCLILKDQAKNLAKEKDRLDELNFYMRFEKIAAEYLSEKLNRERSANVDFYSGFVYDMMDIPKDLYTPLFVLSRMIGWISHNVEEKLNSGKIIRPAGKYVGREE